MSIRSALLLAGAMIVLSLAVVYADKAGYLGEETSQRVIQVASGLLVVYFANLAPNTGPTAGGTAASVVRRRTRPRGCRCRMRRSASPRG